MARSLAPSRWSYLQYGDDQAARFCHSVYRTVRILFERLHRILAQEAGEAGAAALRTSPFLSEEPEEHGEIHQTKMERCGEQPRRLPLLLAPISDGGAQIECALCDKQNGKIEPPDHHHTADKTNEKEQGSEPSEDSMREEAERQQAL